MNNKRKKIENLKEVLNSFHSDIEGILEEEQECYNNLPEQFQDGERGEKMEEAINNLEEVASLCEEIENYLEEIIL